MTLDETIETLRKLKPELEHKFAVKTIGIFGSYARAEQTPQSDLDIYVEFDMEKLTMDKYLELIDYLEQLFRKRIDIITKAGVETIRIPNIKEKIKSEMMYA